MRERASKTAAALDAIADWYEEHPEMPPPSGGLTIYSLDSKEEARQPDDAKTHIKDGGHGGHPLPHCVGYPIVTPPSNRNRGLVNYSNDF